jgi:flagellar biogenesis protein FliO
MDKNALVIYKSVQSVVVIIWIKIILIYILRKIHKPSKKCNAALKNVRRLSITITSSLLILRMNANMSVSNAKYVKMFTRKLKVINVQKNKFNAIIVTYK